MQDFYFGFRHRSGPQVIVSRGGNRLAFLPSRFDAFRFSPEFDWSGGMTPGAKQLAAALLLDCGFTQEQTAAVALLFSASTIGRLPFHGWTLSESEIISAAAQAAGAAQR